MLLFELKIQLNLTETLTPYSIPSRAFAPDPLGQCEPAPARGWPTSSII